MGTPRNPEVFEVDKETSGVKCCCGRSSYYARLKFRIYPQSSLNATFLQEMMDIIPNPSLFAILESASASPLVVRDRSQSRALTTH